jgi:DNA-binding MarR family transcriptional regulator
MSGGNERRQSVGRPELAEQCARAVVETIPRVMRAIREETRRHGAPLLSIPQLRTLAFLARQPGACLLHLAENLGVSRPTASTLVDRLVRRGLITRTQDPRERRRVVLTLTPPGARHFRRARRAAHVWLATTLAHLSPEALRRISRGVTMLGEAFTGARRHDSRPRLTGSVPTNGRVATPAPAAPAPRPGQTEGLRQRRGNGKTRGRG